MGLNGLYIWGGTPLKARADMQEEFNTDPDINFIIGTEAMNSGFNLTGASYVFHYDDSWSPAVMNQRTDRAYRIGQKNTVTVISFIVKNTIEERIRKVLYAKNVVASDMLGDDSDESVLNRLSPEEMFKLLI